MSSSPVCCLPGSVRRRLGQLATGHGGVLAALLLCTVAWRSPADDEVAAGDAAMRLIASRGELAGPDLWPGFDPLAYPLAVFDGASTYLVDHPGPPSEFAAVEGAPGVQVMDGRHPLVNANSSVELGGAATATLLFDRLDGDDPLAALAVAVHEAFHVYQGDQFPGWIVDESQLFLHPADHAEALALRRAESLAWRRALQSDDGLPQAALALELRRQRNDLLSDGVVGYERGLELKEGLARYVQDRCLPDRQPGAAPVEGWPAEVVRQRAYVTGATMAHLLDRCSEGWRQRLNRGEIVFLDEALRWALADRAVSPAVQPAAEQAAVAARASEDAAAVTSARKDERAAYLSQEGAAIVVRITGGGPLSPQGFDPLNVRSLGGRDVLHTRWLLLKRGDCEIAIDDRSALTAGAGSHPLFGGVTELVVTGLLDAPAVEDSGSETVVTAPGFSGRFTGADIERTDGLLLITLK